MLDYLAPDCCHDEARAQAKILFITTLDTVPDTVLVLDESGKIRQNKHSC